MWKLSAHSFIISRLDSHDFTESGVAITRIKPYVIYAETFQSAYFDTV